MVVVGAAVAAAPTQYLAPERDRSSVSRVPPHRWRAGYIGAAMQGRLPEQSFRRALGVFALALGVRYLAVGVA